MVGKEEEAARLRRSIGAAVEERNEATRRGDEEVERTREKVKDARRESKRMRGGWEDGRRSGGMVSWMNAFLRKGEATPADSIEV